MKVPFFNITRQYQNNREKNAHLFDEVLSAGSLLQGKLVQTFENRLADICGVRYAVAVNSCTDALAFALTSLGVTAGDEVAVTAFSFIASASCILRIGAQPVFIDVDPKSGLMSPDSLKQRITPKTKAIIAVHLYGQALDIEDVCQIGQSHGIPILEDVAQSLGAFYQNKPVGSFGKVGCLSFDPTKIINGIGSGGAVVTNDEQIRDQIVRQRYHGKSGDSFISLGYNSQMPTLQAAILNEKLNSLRLWEESRNQIATKYNLAFEELEWLNPQSRFTNRTHVQHKYVVTTRHQMALQKHLTQLGIETRIHYQESLNRVPLFASQCKKIHDCPQAEQLSKEVVSLPMFPEMTEEEVNAVIAGVQGFDPSK